MDITNTIATTTPPTYAVLADRFTATVAAVPDWSVPSACEGWSLADVVDHVVTTQRDFLSAHTDLGPAPATGDPCLDWQQHDAAVRAVLPTVTATTYDGAFGRTTVGETLSTFYGFDLLVHRWDIAEPVGLDASMDDGELELLEGMVPAFGEHLYAEGICKRPVDVGPDASRQAKVLATLGRRA